MATHVSGIHKLKVRLLSPAPIFIFLLLFFLCGSARASLISADTVYSLGSFPGYYATANAVSNITDSSRLENSGNSVSSNYTQIFYVSPASGSASGTLGINGGSPTYFDAPNPSFNSVHVQWYIPYSANYTYLYNPTVFVFFRNNESSTSVSSVTLVASYSNGAFTIPNVTSSNYSIYNSYVISDSSGWFCHAFLTIPKASYLSGFGVLVNRPRGQSSSSSWIFDLTSVKYLVSSSTFSVPSGSGGSGGDVDLSGITSQINSLSAQMSSSFQAVNANIDAAESSISASIEDQTTALEGAISDAADSVNDHFDTWDDDLSGAFSSSDAQIVVDTNSSVSGVHQFEQDQIDDTEAALDDVGLDGYSIPSEISGTFSEFGTILTLLFNSFSFVNPLIIFSCTFGIAFVLIGRKSRGSE